MLPRLVLLATAGGGRVLSVDAAVEVQVAALAEMAQPALVAARWIVVEVRRRQHHLAARDRVRPAVDGLAAPALAVRSPALARAFAPISGASPDTRDDGTPVSRVPTPIYRHDTASSGITKPHFPLAVGFARPAFFNLLRQVATARTDVLAHVANSTRDDTPLANASRIADFVGASDGLCPDTNRLRRPAAS